MTLADLVALIHAVDKNRKGCSISLTAINTPPTGAAPYGIVTIGMKDYQQVFHNEDELREILERTAK
jgi:hypothetical protein